MEIEFDDLRDRILTYIGAVKKYPYVLQEKVAEIAEECFVSDEVYTYIDNLGFIDFEKAILDSVSMLAYIEYSNALREKNEALEISFAGRSMNKKYIILEVMELGDSSGPDYLILDLAIEDYLERVTTNEANRFVDVITSESPILGSIVRFFSIIYKKDLSTYEIFEHQYSLPESMKRKPIFENLKEYKGSNKYLSAYRRKKGNNEN